VPAVVESIKSPDRSRTVGLLIAYLCLLSVAQYSANVDRGATFWQAVPWEIIVLYAVFIPLTSRLSRRPLPPEAEERLRRYMEARSTCRHCGTSREPNEILCRACHRKWERGIALIPALGIAWAAHLLFSILRVMKDSHVARAVER
jgi:hypothetical protein